MYIDSSYALDKPKLFEYSESDKKYVYGSYDDLKGLSNTNGKLVYDFDLKSKGTLCIRFKPINESLTARTIIMNKTNNDNAFGLIIKPNHKLYMILNNEEYLISDNLVELNKWQTAILTWDETTFSVYTSLNSLTKTKTVSLVEAKTIIGSNIDGLNANQHLNGQLEMLAYQDSVLEFNSLNKLFQDNHQMSVKTYVDNLGRIEKDVIDTGLHIVENSYIYKSPSLNKTSLQVETINKYDETAINYEYDKLGNITSVITPNGSYQYQYDYLNRLVREYNPINNQTLIITYTTNSNISFKKYYSGNQPLSVSTNNNITPNEVYEYKYEQTYQDQLTKINKYVGGLIDTNEVILYANSNYIGNPSSIGNKELTWFGRRLTNINNNDIKYYYNEEGIRTKKVVGNVETIYELNGSNIVCETKNNETTKYIYNERALLVGFEYHNKVYYYIRDIQGIITEIIDENKEVMVSFKYDSWGKIINKTVNDSTIDNINNFVYKGYYLDRETNWYYLNSRYYDPKLSRFINADNYNYLNYESLQGMNLFAYCENNPVMYFDGDGNFPVLLTILGVAIASYMTYGAIKAYNTSKDLGYDGWSLAGYTASGVVAGDYFVVKDNWDSISKGIDPDYNNTGSPYINFDFTKNKYYSIFTAGLYSKHLNNNYYVKGRTTLGMYLELQAHYVFDKVARPFGITNGNPAWLGAPDLNGDWTAWIFEGIAGGFKPILPIMPRIYP